MRFHDWLLLPQRIALYEPSATAVIADVHLGYSAARQRQGDAVPARSVADELQPLLAAAQTHEIRELLIAGDLFERGYDEGIASELLAIVDSLGIRFIGLVPGNHDRGAEAGGVGLSIFTDGFDLGDWRIIHGDKPAADAKMVMGHIHPAIRVHGRKRACFLTRGDQLVLPAFSLDAAGVDVRRDARWKDWISHISEPQSAPPRRHADAR